MVDPTWFFSTLSQGVAAIVGLLVSARLIQYQLERQRRERRTEDLRKEIQEFEEKYGNILSPMAGTFAGSADFSFWSQSKFLWISGDELNLKIATESSMPVVTLYWAHMVRISNILMEDIHPSPEPSEHYLFSEMGFDRLRESITWLKVNMDQRSIFIENLYSDLGIQSDKPYTANVLDPDPPGESLNDWLQRHQDWNPPSGRNLQSYQHVFSELHRDFQRLDSLRENTIKTFNPGINSFLVKASALILVGVILPLAAITSDVPDLFGWLVIDSTLLYLYEMLLLIGTVMLMFLLLDDLQREFGAQSLPEYVKGTTSSFISIPRIPSALTELYHYSRKDYLNEVWEWVHRRRLTLGLIAFFLGWYGLQLGVFHLFGENVARWWFYFEKPPNSVSPGIIFGPISHDMLTFTHIGSNIFLLFIAGGFAEPFIAKKKFLYMVFGLGYLGTYLANATDFLHHLWIIAGASGGILALWAYAGLKLRRKAYEYRPGLEFSRDSMEQITAVILIIGIPAFLLKEAIWAAQFHSGHVIGLLLGCVYFGYEYYFKTT